MITGIVHTALVIREYEEAMEFYCGKLGFTVTEDELIEHCKKVTAPYKHPREIEFMTELPKTISGKIRRVELRQRA